MNRFLMLVLAGIFIAATACNKAPNKAEQLSALDDAYRVGLLTKDEYDAKRLALTGTPTTAATLTASETPTAQGSAPVPLPLPVPAAPPNAIASPAETAPSLSPAEPAASSLASSKPAPAAHANRPEPTPTVGCEAAEYKSGGQKGADERFFAAPPETVRRAAISALNNLDFNVHKNSKDEIEASKKRHFGAIVGAGGERVILTLQNTKRAGQAGTRVIGETKKNFVGHIAQKTWTDAVFAEMACKLGVASASVH